MTKAEFLEHLEKRLQILNKKERDDILSEYAQHIELKMANGLSEEAVILDFGNLDELEAEILDAYNVNPDYGKRTFQIGKGKIKSKVARAGKQVEGLWKRGHFSMTGLFHDKLISRLRTPLRFCLIIGVLFLVYLPLLMIVLWVGNSLYSYLSSPFDSLILWGSLIGFHLVYLIFSLLALYGFAHENSQNRALEDRNDSIENTLTIENRKTEKFRLSLALPLKNLVSDFHFTKMERAGSTKKTGNLFSLIWNFIKDLMALILKAAAICIITPILLFVFMQVVLFGIILVLLVLGYPVIGMSIIFLGGLLSSFAFIWFLWDSLFTKKRGVKIE